MTPYQKHKRKWSHCRGCPLHENRQQVVLCRGVLPADVLFVGEGPGESEDALGRPFVGPAGGLFDELLSDAMKLAGLISLRYAVTNIVACIPLNDDDSREGYTRAPRKEEAKACATRLHEMVLLCQPKLIVCLGQVANGLLSLPKGYATVKRTALIHPAAILQMKNNHQANQAFMQSMIRLGNALRMME